MSISQNQLFIYENNPAKNLEILANFNLSDIASTRCMTETVYRKLPKWDVSHSTMREISLLGAGATFLTGPFGFLLAKVYECGGMLLSDPSKAKSCSEKLLENMTKAVPIMTYLCFASAVTLAGIGTYAALRSIFRDESQGERFELLDKEYLAAAHSLLEQYRIAGKKEGVVQIARQLADKSELIHANLKLRARLTEAQTTALTVKISHSAKSILQSENHDQPTAPKPVLNVKG